MQLPLERNTDLLHNSDVMNLVWETNEEGGRMHYFVNFC